MQVQGSQAFELFDVQRCLKNQAWATFPTDLQDKLCAV